MPWRGSEYEGEFPSLGWGILDWIEKYLRVPDGPLAGEPLYLTDEQAAILVRFYGLDDRGRFPVRRAAVRRPQGWGKSPFLAAIALAELAGPVRFDGWDAQGEPVGVECESPWVQIAACSEDQTDNTYVAAHAMIQDSDLAGSTVDVGLTRMFLEGRQGRLEPVTASADSRLGQRITFAVLDETHLWTRRNGGEKLAKTIRRGAAKMNGRTFESTNAHLVGEGSVAERTFKAAEDGVAGLLYDCGTVPEVEDLTDPTSVLRGLEAAYADSARFVDLPRLALEVADPGTDESDSRRFYFNQLRSGGECPFDVARWETLGAVREVGGERVALGFDGSISDDQTTIYGCTEDGFVFHVATWARPPGSVGWTVPRLEVQDTVRDTFARFNVGLMLCDPPLWRSEIEGWAELYRRPASRGVSEGDRERVLAFETQHERKFSKACDRFATAIREGTLSHDGDDALTLNLAACAKKRVRLADDETDMRSPYVIVKADTRKIDRAVAAVLAVQAASEMPPEQSFEPFVIMS